MQHARKIFELLSLLDGLFAGCRDRPGFQKFRISAALSAAGGRGGGLDH